jgi:hypothetical protein
MNGWVNDPLLVTLQWRKSSRSGMTANCVEVGSGADRMHVRLRDSKNPGGAVLSFGRQSYAAFIADVKSGAFDHPGGQPSA